HISNEARTFIEDAAKQKSNSSRALLPTFFPSASGNMLIYRNYWCVNAVDIRTGEVLWESIGMVGSLDALVTELQLARAIPGWLKVYAQQDSRGLILFENPVVGMVALDEKHVYAIDELAVPPDPSARRKPEQFSNWNRLIALDRE